LEHRALLARVMAIQSGVLNGAGQLQRSHVIRQEGLQRAQADGLRILQALFRDQMGTYYAETGQDLAALPHFEAGVALAHELGNTFSEAITRYNLACSLHSLTRFDESMEQVRAALQLVMDAEMTEVQGRCHLLIGRLHLDDGAEVRAQLAFQACIEAFAAAGLPHYESQGHAGLALLALSQGDLARACASAEEVDQRIQNNDALVGIDSPCLPLLACWKVWQRAGDARALPALRRVVNNVQKIAELAGDDEALRRSVLENVPLHREVMQAWQAWQAHGH
jgi:tetratricopeptide (TPR) repeat protein